MKLRARAARVSTVPTVNLLSEAHFAGLATRRLRHRFLFGGAVMVLLIAAAWGYQHVRVGQTRKLVAVEQAQTSRLTSQTQQLAPIRTFVNGVTVQQNTVATAMAGEVYVSDVLAGVRDATPLGARLAVVSVTITPPAGTTATGAVPGASACPGPDPFNTRVVIGCVTLSGTAASRAEVGEMVVRLGQSKLFVEPFVSTTTAGTTNEVSFSGSVGLSERAYSGRYAAPAPTVPTAPTAVGGS